MPEDVPEFREVAKIALQAASSVLDEVHDSVDRMRAEINGLRLERDRYRRMTDCLYDRMVTVNYQEDFSFYRQTIVSCLIMTPEGRYCHFDCSSREEVVAHWRKLWSLDQI